MSTLKQFATNFLVSDRFTKKSKGADNSGPWYVYDNLLTASVPGFGPTPDELVLGLWLNQLNATHKSAVTSLVASLTKTYPKLSTADLATVGAATPVQTKQQVSPTIQAIPQTQNKQAPSIQPDMQQVSNDADRTAGKSKFKRS